MIRWIPLLYLLSVSSWLDICQGAEPTVAERMFELWAKPEFRAVKPPEVLRGPPIMPVLPESLMFERSWQRPKYCGPIALYFFLKLHGRDVDLQAVIDKVSPAQKGSSFADLERAADDFGVASRVIRISPDDLPRLPSASIVHWSDEAGGTEDGHFDVLLRWQNGVGYDVINTTNCSVMVMQPAVVSARLSGYALVATEPMSSLNLVLWIAFGLVWIFAVFYSARLLLPVALSKSSS